MTSETTDRLLIIERKKEATRNRIFLAITVVVAMLFGSLLTLGASAFMGNNVHAENSHFVSSRSPALMAKAARTSWDTSSVFSSSADMIEEAEFSQAKSIPKASAGEFQDFINEYDENMDRLESKEYTTKRMLVHEGHLSGFAWKGELNEVVDRIEDIIKDSGDGYIENKSVNTQDPYSYYRGRGSESREQEEDQPLKEVSMTVRVQSDRFHAVVESVRDFLGEERIRNVRLSSRDVTEQFVDASSRADVLDASRRSMKGLLSKAATVQEVLNIQREINLLTTQYESQKQRANHLQKQSSLSTLTITMQEKSRKDHNKHHRPKGAFVPLEMVQLAVAQVQTAVGLMGNMLVYCAVLAIPLLVLTWMCFQLWSVSSKRRN